MTFKVITEDSMYQMSRDNEGISGLMVKITGFRCLRCLISEFSHRIKPPPTSVISCVLYTAIVYRQIGEAGAIFLLSVSVYV